MFKVLGQPWIDEDETTTLAAHVAEPLLYEEQVLFCATAQVACFDIFQLSLHACHRLNEYRRLNDYRVQDGRMLYRSSLNMVSTLRAPLHVEACLRLRPGPIFPAGLGRHAGPPLQVLGPFSMDGRAEPIAGTLVLPSHLIAERNRDTQAATIFLQRGPMWS